VLKGQPLGFDDINEDLSDVTALFLERAYVVHRNIFKPLMRRSFVKEKYAELLNLMLGGGRPCRRVLNAVLFTYRHVI